MPARSLPAASASAPAARAVSSLTYTIEAESRAQLDRIYQDLTDSGVVLVAL